MGILMKKNNGTIWLRAAKMRISQRGGGSAREKYWNLGKSGFQGDIIFVY